MKKYRNPEQTGRRGSELASRASGMCFWERWKKGTSAYRPTALRTAEGAGGEEYEPPSPERSFHTGMTCKAVSVLN